MLVLVSSAPAGLVVPGSAQHRPHRGRSPSPRLSDKPPALGFTFTPGGLLFPYYVGIAYSLKEAGLVSPTTPVGGSSAGSIVAAALACGVEEETVLSGLAALVEDVRSGTRLNPALRKQLDVLMPEDAARLAMEHNLAVGYLRVSPWPKACIVTEWESKADLIDTVRRGARLLFEAHARAHPDTHVPVSPPQPCRCARRATGPSSSRGGPSCGAAASSPSTASSPSRARASAALRSLAPAVCRPSARSPSAACRASAWLPLLGETLSSPSGAQSTGSMPPCAAAVKSVSSRGALWTGSRCPKHSGSLGPSSRRRMQSWRAWCAKGASTPGRGSRPTRGRRRSGGIGIEGWREREPAAGAR